MPAPAPPDPSTVRLPGPWRHRDVSANGIRLHIAEAGIGPLVLLLHGFGEFWWTWHRQLPALADAGYRVVAADLRGYGDSDKPPRGYDAWTLAGDVAGLIRALGEPRAHLVGHAWGGMLGCAAAALHPRLVTSLALLGAAHPLALRNAIRRTALRRGERNQARALGHLFRFQVPMAPERRLVKGEAGYLGGLLAAWSGPRWRDSDDFACTTRVFRDAMQIPGVAHSALEYYRWAFRAQFRGEGRRFAEALDRPITAPVLRLHGAADRCVLPPTAAADRWFREPGEFQPWQDIGHFPHLEDPDRTTGALTRFLAGHHSG